MAYRIYIGDLQMMEDLLNGHVLLGPFSTRGLAVGGKTLVFTNPAGTVTFSGASGAMRTLREIIDEIEAVHPGAAGLRTHPTGPQYSTHGTGGMMQIYQSIVLRGGAGFEIAETGTANSLLGLSTTDPIISAGAIAAADIVSFGPGSTPAHYALIVTV